eukprot:12935658-Prorocentrum_lima.AAC.1
METVKDNRPEYGSGSMVMMEDDGCTTPASHGGCVTPDSHVRASKSQESAQEESNPSGALPFVPVGI